MNNNLQQLETEVWKYVETLRDSPAARLQAREAFYQKYGQENSTEKFGFGDSEIAFLGWEERSVLRAPGAHPPGSEWWSNVNLWFIYLSALGATAWETGFPAGVLPAPARFWVEYIKEPNPVNWYRAHNSSIIDGYLKYPQLAAKETLPEKVFINMVLYRLLFAQSMVEGKFLFPALGRILGDPRGMAVQFITNLDAYYPSHYPMTAEEIAEVMGKTHSLDELGVKVLDDVLVEPELTHLYALAAQWNNQPGVQALVVNHRPAYPYGIPLPGTQKGWFIRLLIWLRNLFFKTQ